MERSHVPADKTVMFVLMHGGWRMLATFLIVVAPLYGWIYFYYLSTGAWHQSADLIRMNAPILATFLIPMIIGAWIIGFRRWYAVLVAVLAAIIAGWTPPVSIATQVLPDSYVNLAIVLVLLMIGLRMFQYWRDYIVSKLPIARYTRSASTLIIAIVVGLLIMLLPA